MRGVWASTRHVIKIEQINIKRFLRGRPPPCCPRLWRGCGGVAASVLHPTKHLLLNNTSMLLRVAASLFCTYWMFQTYIWFNKHISDKGTPPPCKIDSSKSCPTPALQPLFVNTGWLHLIPPWFRLDSIEKILRPLRLLGMLKREWRGPIIIWH